MDRNGVIAVDGGIPWDLAEERKFFRVMTLGKRVIMGRRTWDSLPGPLDGRENVVLTKSKIRIERGPVIVAATLETAIEPGAVVIGGAELYRTALAWGYVSQAIITVVDATYDGNTTTFPDFEYITDDFVPTTVLRNVPPTGDRPGWIATQWDHR